MQRNKTNPREYNNEPKKRNAEKETLILKWLSQFQFTTRKIALEYLGLNTNSHHTYFKKLTERNILQKIRVYSINERYIYMLTLLGKKIASERYQEAIYYNVNQSSINHAEIRHSLAIQKAILNEKFDNFIYEKFIYKNNIIDMDKEKIPDACIIKNNQLTMIEVELTPKKEDRIFRALAAHVQALEKRKYHAVKYIFPSNQLKEYYLKRFNLIEWPLFEKETQTKKWGKLKETLVINDSTRKRFEFVENIEISGI